VTVRAAATCHVTRDARITIVSDMVEGLHIRDLHLVKE
jgi:hypothetical protein